MQRPSTADEVRQAFVDFFASKQHRHYPSSSLVPEEDPTLLFTSAGMVQMKPFFLGLRPAPAPRLVTSQKCFRTVDIDVIGNQRTLTFFEMLGNFSVGDYFKAGAIAFAWEFITKWLQFDANRVWVTIYPTDDEAYRAWTEDIGFPVERIVRLEDNWWAAGPTGPCGPDSELYYDRGAEHGCGNATCLPGCDCERYLEFWNLVFMQYNRGDDGELTDLPTQNIDTGMGLERLSMLMQGVNSVYDTDLFRAIMRRGEELAGVQYGDDPKTDFSLRVIADHSRAVSFLATDGVMPSNEGRGYVMRRILRRAVWHGRALGLQTGFLQQSAGSVIDLMGHAFPDLRQRRESTLAIIGGEERRFGETLEFGLKLLNEVIDNVRATGATIVPGADAFRLHDTFGFPIELTLEVAGREGLTVDEAGFDELMTRQRQLGKQSARFGVVDTTNLEIYANLPATEFVGYTEFSVESPVVALVVDGQLVERANSGETVEIVLAKTPFYAESGGQIGDQGAITIGSTRVAITDTRKVAGDVILHHGVVENGAIQVGATVTAAIDADRRADTQRNHTATHLLHAALHQVLGAHALQRGSLVAPDRLRFDFAHSAAMKHDEIVRVEALVNAAIRRNHVVAARQMRHADAMQAGVTALFGDKYGDIVRVVDIEGYSQELCGGAHVNRTGDIGFFKITGESSAAAGVRRVEAITGHTADEWVRTRVDTLARLGNTLRSPDVESKVADLLNEVDRLKRELTQRSSGAGRDHVAALLANAIAIGDTTLVCGKLEIADRDQLKGVGDDIKSRLSGKRGVVVLAGQDNGKVNLGVMATKGSGIDATAIVRRLAEAAGGRGGGRPGSETAEGAGATDKIDAALALTPTLIAT